ncbi:metal-dependent hydrolase, partial [Escherichia coli]
MPNKLPAWLGVVFCLNGIVHLLLDTLVGDIWWLMP